MPARLLQKLTVMMSPDDMRKLQRLAALEGEGMSTVVRTIVRREYNVRIRSPKRKA